MKPSPLESAINEYDNEDYYGKQLRDGVEYQDFVAHELCKRGMPIVSYGSRKFQYDYGENMLGAEIKYDKKFRETGNLYIETAEKSHPSNSRYVPSGVMREDNSWLFMIGDYRDLYIFPTNFLRKLIECKNWRFISDKPTSQGYLMPLADGNKYNIRKISFGE